jgi:diguanylate cyclase (GGDEF)-like protein
MIDIDAFKRFNDSFGHPAGDKALQDIGKLFRENCRRVDYICRYGGEEFAIITPETSGKNAVHLARRLVDRAREMKIQIYESVVEEGLTISIGLAGYPTDAKTKEDLIIQADKYLLEAKKAGKGCFFPPSP